MSLLDNIKDAYRLYQAKATIRRHNQQPDWVTGRGGVEQVNQDKYPLRPEICDTYFTIAISK